MAIVGPLTPIQANQQIAVNVLEDELALTFTGTVHFHTERRNNVRIISAGKATRYEKSIYEKI